MVQRLSLQNMELISSRLAIDKADRISPWLLYLGDAPFCFCCVWRYFCLDMVEGNSEVKWFLNESFRRYEAILCSVHKSDIEKTEN